MSWAITCTLAGFPASRPLRMAMNAATERLMLVRAELKLPQVGTQPNPNWNVVGLARPVSPLAEGRLDLSSR